MVKREQFKHDHYFRHAMKLPQVFIPFLLRHLPATLAENLDIERADPMSSELLNAKLNERFVDMLYTVPYKDQQVFIYILVEHQSKGHPMMAFRMVVYCLEIWDKLLSLRANAQKDFREQGTPIPDYLQFEKLPPIFPFVFYNGEKEWQPKSFLEKLEDPEMFLELLQTLY